MIDVVIATEDQYAPPKKLGWYELQLLLEDELLKNALESKGLNVTRQSWSNTDFDWSSCKAVIIRSTWDYFDRINEFKAWIQMVENNTTLFNCGETLRWNMNKRYLFDLESKGINIVPSLLINNNSRFNIAQIMQDQQWNEAILKPTVSAGAIDTFRVNESTIENVQQKLDSLIGQKEFLLQPFQKSICDQGEISLMVMGGKVSHAILKVAKSGDFRVQDNYGGTVQTYLPSENDIRFAESIVSAVEPKPIYARVDIIRDNNGELALMELELIEPELFFRFNRPAAFQLADTIHHHISNND